MTPSPTPPTRSSVTSPNPGSRHRGPIRRRRPAPPSPPTLDLRRAGAIGAALVGLVAALGIVRMTTPPDETELAFFDGAAWLPSLAMGGVSLLDGSDGDEITALAVADPGDELEVTQWGSDALVVNSTRRTMGRLDSATWRFDGVSLDDDGGVLRLLTGGSDGWLLGADQLTAFDLTTLQARSPLPVTAEPGDGVVLDDGTLLLAGTTASAPVRRYRPSSDQATEVDGLSGAVRFTRIGSRAAAVDPERGLLWLDGDGVVCDDLGFRPDPDLAPASDGTTLVVVGTGGEIAAWPLLDRSCPGADDLFDVGLDQPGQPVVTDGWLVVPDEAGAGVISIDPSATPEPRVIELPSLVPGTDFDLVAEVGTVWFNDPASNAAGVIKRDGSVELITKYDSDGEGGFTEALSADDTVVSEDGQEPPEDAASPELEEPDSDTGEEPDPTGPGAADGPDGGDAGDPDPASGSDQAADGPDDPGEPATERPDPGDPSGGDEVDPGAEPDPDQPSGQDPGAVGDGVQVHLQQTASQILVGGTATFVAAVDNGSPSTFRFSVSPSGPEQTVSNGSTVRYRFDTTGTFTITVEACDGDDCKLATARITVVDDLADVAVVAHIVDPGTVPAGEDVTLHHASEGPVDQVAWTIAGASPATSTDPSPTVRWDTPGTYRISLTVTGGDGVEDTAVRSVTVSGAPEPYPITVSGPSTVVVDDPASFTATAVEPLDDLTFTVEGDPVVAVSGSTATVTWSKPGTYTVGAGAGPDGLGSGSRTVTVTARPVPVELSLAGPSTVTVRDDATFSAVPSGGAVAGYRWAVDGATVSGQVGDTFTTSWSAVGDHLVTATAITPAGLETDASLDVTVEPAALLAPTDVSCSIGGLVVNETLGITEWEVFVSWTDPNADADAIVFSGGGAPSQTAPAGATSQRFVVNDVDTPWRFTELVAMRGAETAATTLPSCGSRPSVGAIAINLPFLPIAGFAATYSATRASTTPALGFSWDFGDGTPVITEAAPAHIYAVPEVFTIDLTVRSEPLAGSTMEGVETVSAEVSVGFSIHG